MDEAEYYHYSIADAARKRENLTKDELKWAKKLGELDGYWEGARWDEDGKIIKKKSFWEF